MVGGRHADLAGCNCDLIPELWPHFRSAPDESEVVLVGRGDFPLDDGLPLLLSGALLEAPSLFDRESDSSHRLTYTRTTAALKTQLLRVYQVLKYAYTLRMGLTKRRYTSQPILDSMLH